MRGLFCRFSLVALLVSVLVPCGRAAEGGDALMLWDRFVSALRAGQVEQAYRCFSPESRKTLDYETFCARHHPAMVGNEAILSPVNDGQFRISGDWAQYRYAAAGNMDASGVASGAKPAAMVVTALMVREEGTWYLVDPARQSIARTEAETRNLLRRIGQIRTVTMARESGKTLPDVYFAQLLDGDLAGPESALSSRYYDFQMQDGTLSAVPKRSGLRGFCVSRGGDVLAIAGATPGEAAPAAAASSSVPDHADPLSDIAFPAPPSLRREEHASYAKSPARETKIDGGNEGRVTVAVSPEEAADRADAVKKENNSSDRAQKPEPRIPLPPELDYGGVLDVPPPAVSAAPSAPAPVSAEPVSETTRRAAPSEPVERLDTLAPGMLPQGAETKNEVRLPDASREDRPHPALVEDIPGLLDPFPDANQLKMVPASSIAAPSPAEEKETPLGKDELSRLLPPPPGRGGEPELLPTQEPAGLRTAPRQPVQDVYETNPPSGHAPQAVPELNAKDALFQVPGITEVGDL